MEYQCQLCDQSCDNDLNHSIEVSDPRGETQIPAECSKERLLMVIANFKMVIAKLNDVINSNYYPVPQTNKFDRSNRPIGIGVENLQDVFILMDWPFLEKGDLVI